MTRPIRGQITRNKHPETPDPGSRTPLVCNVIFVGSYILITVNVKYVVFVFEVLNIGLSEVQSTRLSV